MIRHWIIRVRRRLAAMLGFVHVRESRRLSDTAVMDALAADPDNTIIAAINELIARGIENARRQTESVEAVNAPREMAFFAGGAAHLQTLRDCIEETRRLALLRSEPDPEPDEM